MATEDRLKEVWGLLLAECLRYLKETPPEQYQAQYLNVIRAFLRDNDITIDGNHLLDVQQSLAKLAALDLPFPKVTPKLN